MNGIFAVNLKSLKSNVVREILPAIVGYSGNVCFSGNGCRAGCGGVEEDWAVIIEGSVVPVLDVGGETSCCSRTEVGRWGGESLEL